MKARKNSGWQNKTLFFIAFFSVFCICSSFAQEQEAQSDTTRKDAIRLFLDCRFCDTDYMKKEIPYINYVRDIRESQVYILVTSQSSSSGGNQNTLFFTGREEFTGMNDTLSFSTYPDDTQELMRMGLTKTIAMGLMRYVAKTPIRNNVAISYIGEVQEKSEQVADKWDYWVFELFTLPSVNLSKSVKSFSVNNRISANRITPELKLENAFDYDYYWNNYIRSIEDPETEEITEIETKTVKKSWSFTNLTVKSINDHWSAGLQGELISSSFSNLDLRVKVAPAIEYDIFPYSESTRKQIRIMYGIGFVYNNYIDTTIYDKMYERLFQQSLDIAMEIRQSWGSAIFSLNASNYLHDWSKNIVKINGNLQWRLFKGLSLSIRGSAALIHNQIELAKGGRSVEDVYLDLRELETNYSYEGRVGLTYTFGSIYSNIVNPRFGGGGRQFGG